VITRAQIDDFLSRRRLAVLGVSRQKSKFGNILFKELAGKGYELTPVHPVLDEVRGRPCARRLTSLPEPVDGAVIVLPRARTEEVLADVAAAGIARVWLQQGSESEAALEFCRENGIEAIHGECILMFVPSTGFVHRVHRWINRVLGKLPE